MKGRAPLLRNWLKWVCFSPNFANAHLKIAIGFYFHYERLIAL